MKQSTFQLPNRLIQDSRLSLSARRIGAALVQPPQCLWSVS